MLELGLERPEKRVRLDLVEVRIALADLEPEIWRSVLLPVTNDLHDLNLAILGCMGWTGFREHAFYRGQDLIENEFDVVLADLVGDTERPLRLYNDYMRWRKAPFDPEAFDLEEIQSYVHGMMRYG